MTGRSPSRPGPSSRAGAATPTPPRGRLVTTSRSPLRTTSNGIQHANSSAAGSASEREDVFPEDPAVMTAPAPVITTEPTAAATVAAGAAFAGGAALAASPFASARNQRSFAAGSDAGGRGGGGGRDDDRRSEAGSTTVSSTTTGERGGAGCVGWPGLSSVEPWAWLAIWWPLII